MDFIDSQPTQEQEPVYVGYISADCPNPTCGRRRLELFVDWDGDSEKFHSIVCEKCEQKVLAADFKW